MTFETNNDIEERRRSQETLAKAQAELAHVSRVATLGELPSIAHEVDQPVQRSSPAARLACAGLAPEVPPLDRVTAASSG